MNALKQYSVIAEQVTRTDYFVVNPDGVVDRSIAYESERSALDYARWRENHDAVLAARLRTMTSEAFNRCQANRHGEQTTAGYVSYAVELGEGNGGSDTQYGCTNCARTWWVERDG